MSPQEFCYWLQGFIEIQQPEEINNDQLQVIKDHLQLVFNKETPNRLPGTTIKLQDHFIPQWNYAEGVQAGELRLFDPDSPIASC